MSNSICILRIVMQNSWQKRVLILTVLWILWFLRFVPENIGAFAVFGLFPPLIIWGSIWVISSFKKERQKSENKEE